MQDDIIKIAPTGAIYNQTIVEKHTVYYRLARPYTMNTHTYTVSTVETCMVFRGWGHSFVTLCTLKYLLLSNVSNMHMTLLSVY